MLTRGGNMVTRQHGEQRRELRGQHGDQRREGGGNMVTRGGKEGETW